MTYRFINEHHGRWPVAVMCDTLNVSTAGYYAWRDRPASIRHQRQETLTAQIRVIHTEVKARYGSPRIHAELVARGHGCCVNTVARLMHEAGIAAKTTRKFRHTTDSNHHLPVAENRLDRQFDPTNANEAWVADITYVPTREGWLYLAVVEDLFARMVVGWSMAARMTSRLVVDALAMAVQLRLPGEELLAHSDRGSQYASEHYQRLLSTHRITCSMSRRANCWDNAPMESLFASLKKELVHHEDHQSRAKAKVSIVEYIEVFYNRQRRHATLGFKSPVDYEQPAYRIILNPLSIFCGEFQPVRFFLFVPSPFVAHAHSRIHFVSASPIFRRGVVGFVASTRKASKGFPCWPFLLKRNEPVRPRPGINSR